MKVIYSGLPCYHPGAGLDLVPGEMDVTEEQAVQLAGLVKKADAPKSKRGETPQERE